MRMLARASLLVLALVTCAWFALGSRQARDIQRASAIVTGTGSIGAADAARARALLRSAGELNPDRSVDILRAQLALARRQPVAAEHILRSVTSDEPLNLEAWGQLAVAALQDGDRPTFVTAGRKVAELEPEVK